MRLLISYRGLAACILLGSLLQLVGCGGKYSFAPVSGTITLDGTPLIDATVTFTPEAKGGDVPASSGRTDTSGKYTLKMISDNSTGALIGKHTVVVSKNFESQSDVSTPAERQQAALPEHNLTFEVKSGSNQADFDIGKK